jgi:hypothetical protein
MNALTAIHYWPNWCSAARMQMPEVLALMQEKKCIKYISVNDPDSRNYVSKRLMRQGDVLGAYYQLERYGREKLVAINDRSQQRYFKRYFLKDNRRVKHELIEYFLLFDQSGKLLYHNTDQFTTDTLRNALAAYH